MKKLVVCGDSFMSPCIDESRGLHFTELLTEKIGWELVPLARGGCGNQTIRLQIEEAIKMQPDCVIIGLTSPDRFEFPIVRGEHLYTTHGGLSNISYQRYPDASALNDLFDIMSPTLESLTMSNVFNGFEENFSEYDRDVIQKWYTLFYDFHWKTQTDAWIIYGGLRRLEDLGIPFYCINHTLGVHDLDEFGDVIIKEENELNPWTFRSTISPYRFHTDEESQRTLYINWYNKLHKDGLL